MGGRNYGDDRFDKGKGKGRVGEDGKGKNSSKGKGNEKGKSKGKGKKGAEPEVDKEPPQPRTFDRAAMKTWSSDDTGLSFVEMLKQKQQQAEDDSKADQADSGSPELQAAPEPSTRSSPSLKPSKPNAWGAGEPESELKE